jgi:hypothetical protein
MQYVTSAPAAVKPRRTPGFIPSQADKLDALARRVTRLGYGARDAEAFVVEKLTLAAELRALAREVRP